MKKNKYDEKFPKLLNSIVCAIDILGFSDMILDSCNNGLGNNLLGEINYLIEKNKKCIIPDKYSQGKIKIFTDNMVVAYPIDNDGESELNEILDNVAEYQFNLALEGLFVRGGISIGEFYINEDIVFGPALLDAHYQESQVACYPRIVLDDKTVGQIQIHIQNYNKMPENQNILIDTDGKWFIGYLNTIFKYYKECNNDYEFGLVKIKLLEKHKEKLEEMLMKHKENIFVWDKYVWTANYHNFFCDLYFPLETDLKIAKHLLLSWPRQISTGDF
ncbi:hypothetical protein [Anaerotignum propionicum]|uniref:Guanylate cyclase domain-containing protein n=1 Tax=Anaerotignum propionicum DSM 1682 TaxID=991789 RepID=A0A0X8VA33_ANAPI|nr:hypothetical protein [Anaerotignum propionicum]AMJ40234.1 hypothetical protein CPRO_06310 [Anaerotignum propionicum DSM 1682]SHE47035.1 hypothetical protein SAMN02745151_00847 [[Clostridium] propionicum DSM 1682] [Anaerotignum propionicum DSM 1682]